MAACVSSCLWFLVKLYNCAVCVARVLIKLEKNNRKTVQLHSTGQTLGFLALLAQKYKSIFGYTTTYKLSPVRQGLKRQHCGCAFNLIFKNLIKIPMEGVTDGTHASAIQPDIFSSTFVSVIFWNEGQPLITV